VGAWALVLGLLVAPPAISAGQDPEPTEPPTASSPVPPVDRPPPPEGGPETEEAEPVPAPGAEPARSEGTGAPAAAPEPEVVATAPRPSPDRVAGAAAAFAVSIGDNFYSPKTISVTAGDTVTWTNGGTVQHSVTAQGGSFDTGVFGPGGSRSVTFSTPGTFPYYCTVHGLAQSGVVKVEAAPAGGRAGGGSREGSRGPSEADAVAAPDAAGSATGLPSTGLDLLPPAAVGILLLLIGFAIRFRDWIGPA
jgi:plastocyanin